MGEASFVSCDTPRDVDLVQERDTFCTTSSTQKSRVSSVGNRSPRGFDHQIVRGFNQHDSQDVQDCWNDSFLNASLKTALMKAMVDMFRYCMLSLVPPPTSMRFPHPARPGEGSGRYRSKTTFRA
jgi:hypothetical protein